MSNFNQFFRDKGAGEIVKRFFVGADTHTQQKITDLKWRIADIPEQPASYYIENGLTATHKVIINYTIDYGKDILESFFEIPKEIDGTFIIDGAYRIATNTLNADYDCRFNLAGRPPYYINFDFYRKYDLPKECLKIKIMDPVLNVLTQTKEIKLDNIDKVTGVDRENWLKLTERQSKKLQIKLDLDTKPEYITKDLIQKCLAFGDDRYRDLIIDKSIDSVATGFMKFMFKPTNLIATRRSINQYWIRYKSLQSEVKSITRLSQRFFKGSSEKKKGESDVQVAPGINAMNLNSIGSKIQVGASVAINNSMLDLIDVGDTPINQNVNKQNSLTVSTHVTDEGVLFDCYDLNFKKITIDYLDYLNHKVCASEYVDYDKNEIKPDENGNVVVKYRMKRVTVPKDEVELVDLHPDYRLSTTTRRIPLINFTDSVRIHMGSSMLKQSIPLVNAERPLVDTGNNEELKNNILNETFKYPEGKVKEITEKAVLIELPNKEIVEIPRRTAIQSINDVDVFTEPKVKVGQKIKQGDIITGSIGLEEDTYKMGLNALVLFHAMFGEVHEDAVVVSESFAKKMCNYSIIDLAIDIKSHQALKWIAPIGTKVKSLDKIVKVYESIKLDELNRALTEELGGLFGEGFDMTEYTRESSLKVPNNIDEAYVVDVLIQENKKPKFKAGTKKPNLTFSHTSEKVMEEYDKDRKVVYDMFPEYIAADRLKPISLEDKNPKVVYSIRIRLVKRTNLMIGSKLTNRFGGKGVISKIMPDEEMPIMVDKTGKKERVEVVMNPYSTINRKIPSVLIENSLGLIAHKIHDLVEEYKGTKAGREKIMPMLAKYYPGRYDDMSVDKFIEFHNSHRLEDVYYFNVGCYSTKFNLKLVEEWSKELGVESKSKILMPSKNVADLNELKKELEPEQYQKVVSKMEGKFTEVDKPLMCGYLHMEELYHIPTYSNKVTSSMFGDDVNEKKDSPILGRGKYRQTGQKIGEMELSAYLARSAKKFIDVARGDTMKEDNQLFLNNLLGLGLTVSDEKGYNQGGSSLKSKLNQMKVKFRLKNQNQ